MSQGCDVVMSKARDSMSGGRRLSVLMSVPRVLERLPGVLVSGQMILLSMLLRHTMGMRGAVVQLGGALVILVMGSVVIACRH